MRSIKLLDCTLRDGGFVNDWHFGIGSIKSIISRLYKAQIDIIEVGFVDNRRPFDPNRSIFPNVESINPIFSNIEVNHTVIVAMIDYGTCNIETICEKRESKIDGIRVIFKKKDYEEALHFCRQIKEKGYMVFVQPVSITSYSDMEMIDLIEKANQIEPNGFSIVDTYGLMHKKELKHYFYLIDHNLNENIWIGYHAHNNFQLAYANSLELISLESKRTIVIDGTLYGMGKGAGNAGIELLALHLNENYNQNYDINQLMEAIDVDISKEYTRRYWGYSLLHYIAATNDCHPDYVKYLIDRKTLAVKSINEILSTIEPKDRLQYDSELIQNLYQQYQDNNIDDAESYEKLRTEILGRDILILAPGNTILTHKVKIDEFIEKRCPLVFSINFLSDHFQSDYVFMGNAKRYSQFFNKIYDIDTKARVICTSNITESNQNIDFRFNFSTLMSEEDLIRDNPVIMLLKILKKVGIKQVHLAGFDGYTSTDRENYFRDYIQFLYCDDNVLLRNELISQKLKDEFMGKIELKFLTPSIYIK